MLEIVSKDILEWVETWSLWRPCDRSSEKMDVTLSRFVKNLIRVSIGKTRSYVIVNKTLAKQVWGAKLLPFAGTKIKSAWQLWKKQFEVMRRRGGRHIVLVVTLNNDGGSDYFFFCGMSHFQHFHDSICLCTCFNYTFAHTQSTKARSYYLKKKMNIYSIKTRPDANTTTPHILKTCTIKY